MVLPVSLLQGPAATSFEELLRKALQDDAVWEAMTRDEAGKEQAYRALLAWKKDVAAQRSQWAQRVKLGASGRDHARWLISATTFSRAIDRRMATIPTYSPPVRRSTEAKPSNVALQRNRAREWRWVASRLAASVESVESGGMPAASLFALLDDLEVDMGKRGRMSVRDALPLLLEEKE